MNSYYEIHFEAIFKKEIVKQWLNEKTYEIANTSKETAVDELKICERVLVAHTTNTLHNNICYYLIKIRGEDYLSIRSALSRMNELSPAKLKRIDAVLNRQIEMLLKELNQCRENNEHPDTGEKLTDDDIKEMPWLAFEAIPKIKSEEIDAEDEGIESLVPPVIGLKRDPKPTAPSGVASASRNPRDSIESEL